MDNTNKLTPMNFNKNHISGMENEKGATISGDPISFFGTGIVAFIDILGFSKEIIEKWSEDENSPLNRLLKIKESPIVSNSENQIKFGSYSVSSNGKPVFHNFYQCRVQTVSDSIVLSAALPTNLNVEDFKLAFLSIANASLDIWRASLMQGFTIRGGLELDDIFWNNNEIIGPAFIKACHLEQFAKNSRIIIGERFVTTLLFIWKNINKFEYSIDMEDEILTMLMKNFDGYISINPKFMLKRKGVNSQEIINKIKTLQNHCSTDYHKTKYEELISSLSSCKKSKKPNLHDLNNYQSILAKAAEKINR